MTAKYGIVGGGIAGASIAYHLSQRTDEPIVLFERRSPASETTHKSVAQYGFYGDKTQYRMKQYGMELYNQFFENPRANPRYTFMGILMTATETENANQLRTAVETGGEESLGKPGLGFDRDMVEYLNGDELKQKILLPPVNESEISGALFRPRVGYMSRPHELAYEFLERAKSQGVTVRSGTTVEQITTQGSRVTGVVTDNDESIELDEVICAAGPWNIKLAESVGIDLPVRHTIAPVLELQLEDQLDYSMPVINHYESPYAFHRRSPEEFLIGYNPSLAYENADEFDPSTVSDSVPNDIRNEGIELLERLLPGIAGTEVVNEWVGVRSVTPDGNPVVGWTDLEGFSIAAFHTSGIQLAPAVGKMIANQLVDDIPTSYYDPLSITRFDDHSDYRSEPTVDVQVE